MKKIIDLSKYNVVTDWKKVKNAVDGVILRCGYRGWGSGKITLDAKFPEFAEACRNNGIPFGVYFMSQAINAQEGIQEASYAVSLANQYGATLGVYIDSEDGDGTAKVVRADGLSKSVRTAVVRAFCEAVNATGYVGGVYASESWFNDRLNFVELKQYRIWVAKYGKNTGGKCTNVTLSKCDMHQYTSKGSIPGISGNVDVSECYIDFGQKQESSASTEHIQKNYKPGVAYFVHCTNLRVRSKPVIDGTNKNVLYKLSNTAVLNKATYRDASGRIWMNISGTSKEEWICADTGAKSFVY